MTPQKLELYKNKALQIREMLLAAELIKEPVNRKKLETFQKNVKNSTGRQGMSHYLKSKLIDADLIFYDQQIKTYFWNEDNDDKLNNVILEYAKECELRSQNERNRIAVIRHKEKQQDTIHEPMLFDIVMREQDQSTVTLKLSPEQFEQLKKHHQLLTTILTTTNQ